MIIIIMIIILITIIIKTIMIILTVIITIIIMIIIITIIMIIIIIINYHSHHHFIINVPVETREEEGSLFKCFDIFLHIANFFFVQGNRICLKTETVGFLSQLSKQARQTVSNS